MVQGPIQFWTVQSPELGDVRITIFTSQLHRAAGSNFFVVPMVVSIE
jgi:hypothetical protein